MLARFVRTLNERRPAEGLAAFRILFGALTVFSTVRFVTNGWVHELYLAPLHRFAYLGFEWVRPWPAWGLYLHFAVMGAAAFALMLGAWTRLAALVFFLCFTYVELLDKTTYLNHYYLVSLLALLLVVVPSGAAWSLDAKRWDETPAVRAWAYHLLRYQVAVVYVFAGLAKLNADWLFRAEPLRTWFRAYTELPLVGPLFAEPWLAWVASWGGVAFDLCIVPLLLIERTRKAAYAVAVFFHVTIWLLFPVGVFSWLMLVSLTLFFAPTWPRALPWPGRSQGLAGAPRVARVEGGALGAGGLLVVAAYAAGQVLVPLRSHAVGGDDWNEVGFRFAWRVMLIEKTGHAEYRVETRAPPRSFVVYPCDELTPLQCKMLSTQPDMIHEHAIRIAERLRASGHEDVRVHADAWVSFNGRPSQRLVDPSADLASLPRTWGEQPWILPLEDTNRRARTALAR